MSGLDALTLALILAPAVGALLSLLIFHAKTGVPPVPSSKKEVGDVVAVLSTLELKEGAIIYELGAGVGTLALALARAFPKARVVGVEISPVPCAIAKLRAHSLPNLTITWQDFRHVELASADVCTAYLMIGAAARLAPVLDQKLRPGTFVIASMFWFRDRKHERTRAHAALYRWPALG